MNISEDLWLVEHIKSMLSEPKGTVRDRRYGNTNRQYCYRCKKQLISFLVKVGGSKFHVRIFGNGALLVSIRPQIRGVSGYY